MLQKKNLTIIGRAWWYLMKDWLNKHFLNKEADTIEEIINEFKKSSDFVQYCNKKAESPFEIIYFSSIVDTQILHKDILSSLINKSAKDVSELLSIIPIEKIKVDPSANEVRTNVLQGSVFVRLLDKKKGILISAKRTEQRNISAPEIEFSVLGPKETFIESLDTNINLLRKRIPILEFKVKEVVIGKLSRTRVAILFIEGIANQENVNTVIQRIESIDFDMVIDSSYITQLIADNELSPFPQLLDTERPDRVASILAEGKIAILTEGSPLALIGPTTLVEFFSSFEDYFYSWYTASFIRLVRFFAVAFSILITPIYVATLTYHYELIPKDLLSTLVISRRVVPLPPILEAIFLELTIELLREAGARLPTKVGQTIGIVGGIVIGTASVEAGITSNILLIIVALSALASFTTPVYKMGNTIRFIRFPFLISAHFWGLLGIVLCFCFLIVHLLRLTSLGRPYLEPFYPLRIPDLKDSLIRLPFSKQGLRPMHVQAEDRVRFKPKKVKKKLDIDE